MCSPKAEASRGEEHAFREAPSMYRTSLNLEGRNASYIITSKSHHHRWDTMNTCLMSFLSTIEPQPVLLYLVPPVLTFNPCGCLL